VKLVVCFKSYELVEGSTVIEEKVAKTVCLWKFGFCRDMSLDLGVLALHKKFLGFCNTFQKLESFCEATVPGTGSVFYHFVEELSVLCSELSKFAKISAFSYFDVIFLLYCPPF
jgi:hypothetical protein